MTETEVEPRKWELYEYELVAMYYDSEKKSWPFIIETRLQRMFQMTKAATIARDFDPNALDVINVSQRKTGEMVLLDGQHRTAGGLLAGYYGPYMARVLKNLTVQQEAKLFRQLNNTSKVGNLELFKVALVEERPEEVRLNKILTDFGLVAGVGAQNSFAAVQTGLRILARRDGEELLRWALTVSIRAWGVCQDALIGQIIEALSMVRGRYGKHIETEHLIGKLASTAGGAQGIIGAARTKQQVYKDSMKVNIADAIVGVHNQHMRKFRLPDWRTSEALAKEAERSGAPQPKADLRGGSGRA